MLEYLQNTEHKFIIIGFFVHILFNEWRAMNETIAK